MVYKEVTASKASFSISRKLKRSSHFLLAVLVTLGSFTSLLFNPVLPIASAATTPGGKWEQMTAGGDYNCALFNSEVFCWGINDRGQLGDGTTTDRLIPTKVGGLLEGKVVTNVTAGGNHTCAIAAGEIYCWGYNGYGQLGNGSTTNSSVPVKVTQDVGLLTGKTVTRSTLSWNHTCVIADSEAYCWGNGVQGQLGDNTSTTSSVPVKVTQDIGKLSGKVITDISAEGGAYHTCVVADGEAYCWGYNGSSQLGNGLTADSPSPVKVTQDIGQLAGKTVTDIATGFSGTCAVASSEVYCWGSNYSGELGDGTTTASGVPLKVEGIMAGKTITAVAKGEEHTCVIADGETYCWGYNEYGELGNGTTSTNDTPPAKVSGILTGLTVSQISISPWNNGTHACALAEGKIYCWGYDATDPTTYPAGMNHTSPVALTYILPSLASNGQSIDGTTIPTIATRPTFEGYAQPGSTVVVTVHSDPITCSAVAYSNGYWSCVLPSDLPDGLHTVTITVTTPSGDVIELGPYTVNVLGSTTVTGTLPTAPNTGFAPDVKTDVSLYGLISLACGVITFLLLHRSRRFAYYLAS